MSTRISISRRAKALAAGFLATTSLAALAGPASAAPQAPESPAAPAWSYNRRPVDVDIVSPRYRDDVGVDGTLWFVDLKIEYPGSGQEALDVAGFTPQLTGPAGHAEIAPLPGAFGAGADDALPGVVVLLSSAQNPGQNFAGVFNLTGVGEIDRNDTEILDTWLVGAPVGGTDVDSTLRVAVVDDLDGNGVYDDAPDVVEDHDGDGDVDKRDLEALGLASKVETVHFHIN